MCKFFGEIIDEVKVGNLLLLVFRKYFFYFDDLYCDLVYIGE